MVSVCTGLLGEEGYVSASDTSLETEYLGIKWSSSGAPVSSTAHDEPSNELSQIRQYVIRTLKVYELPYRDLCCISHVPTSTFTMLKTIECPFVHFNDYCKSLKYSGNNKIAIIALCLYALL